MAKKRSTKKRPAIQKVAKHKGKVLHVSVPHDEPHVVVVSPDRRTVSVVPAPAKKPELWFDWVMGAMTK